MSQVTYKRHLNGRGFSATFECADQRVHLCTSENKAFRLHLMERGKTLVHGGGEYESLTLKRSPDGCGCALLDENGNALLKIDFRGIDNETGKLLPPEWGWEELEEALDNGEDYGDGYFLAKVGETEYPDDEQTNILFFTWCPKSTNAFLTLLDCMTRGEYPQDVNDLVKFPD